MRDMQRVMPHQLRHGLLTTRSHSSPKSWATGEGAEEQYDLVMRLMLLLHSALPVRNQAHRHHVRTKETRNRV